MKNGNEPVHHTTMGEHIMNCNTCDQEIDLRDLSQVFAHEECGGEHINYNKTEQIPHVKVHSVMPSFTVIRWYNNPREDVVCTNKETAKKWCDTYNKIAGEEKCFIDDEICKPYNGA